MCVGRQAGRQAENKSNITHGQMVTPVKYVQKDKKTPKVVTHTTGPAKKRSEIANNKGLAIDRSMTHSDSGDHN